MFGSLRRHSSPWLAFDTPSFYRYFSPRRARFTTQLTATSSAFVVTLHMRGSHGHSLRLRRRLNTGPLKQNTLHSARPRLELPHVKAKILSIAHDAAARLIMRMMPWRCRKILFHIPGRRIAGFL